MKTIVCSVAIGVMLFGAGVSPVGSQAQIAEGYTMVKTPTGPAVCLGRWVPSKDVALPGVCEGEMVDLGHFNAVSSRITADKLDQILLTLAAIDQKEAVNNDQMRQLIDINLKTQASADEQVKQVSDLLHESINKRFDDLSEKLLEDEAFKKEIEKLKADILKEVETAVKRNSLTK
ncbi:MAG TPA: hypothetical protein VK435_09455 [Thermodesulfovibrionales bacterium]|nr:hypothetical protein [Thermodesulfovibrionales bacterium]